MDTNNQTTSQAQHTPGPWKTSEALRPAYAPIIWAENGRRVICSMFYMRNDTAEGGFGAYENHEQNAHLIAAAPDMLAALEAIVKTAVNSPQYVGGMQTLAGFVTATARAAIAKARGGNNG